MNIGLVAHDSKKKLMQNFCIAYRGILAKNWLLTEELSPVREYGFCISAVLPVPHPFIKRAAMQEIHSSFIFK